MTTFLLFVASFLCGGTLFGQYPTDEKIQPYPAPVKERTLRQRFVCNAEGVAQWTALSQSKLTPLGETLRIESSGHDPYVRMPPIEQPRAGTFEFRIRMKNKMNPSAEIFWGTTRQPDTLAENAVRFGFMPDGEWHTYTAEFTTTDPLTLLRFDPGVSTGVAEIAWVELYDVVYGEVPANPTPWVNPNWIKEVKEWKTISSDKMKINFDTQGTGAVVFMGDKAVGEIYPLAYQNPTLPLGGVVRIPFYQEVASVADTAGPLDLQLKNQAGQNVEFTLPSVKGMLRFTLTGSELTFDLKADAAVFGPAYVCAPVGTVLA
jgi:hypothetical protein